MDTKRCPGCEQTKSVEEFNFKNKATGKLQVRCRDCTRLQVRSHYARHVSYYVAKAKTRSRALQARQRQAIIAHLLTHPCVDCGENDIRCLEFDHVRGVKAHNIAEMLGNYEWRTIEAEIAKCEVRCANCHRKKTAKQFGHWNADF